MATVVVKLQQPVRPPVDSVILTLTLQEARVLECLLGNTSSRDYEESRRERVEFSPLYEDAAEKNGEIYAIYAAINNALNTTR